MLKRILILVFLAASLAVSAQQKALVVQKIGTSRRFAFHDGDIIKIRTKTEKLLLKNSLWILNDSTVSIGMHSVVGLPGIGTVYKDNYFPKLMTRMLLIAGAGYFILDSFNNMINNEQVFDPQTMIFSASLMVAGVLFIPLSQKKLRIGLHWKVRVMAIYIP